VEETAPHRALGVPLRPPLGREYWCQKIESCPQMRDAEPNAGHRALARLYAAGLLQGIITQNIDSV